MSRSTDDFKPGQRVVVTQQIPQRDEVWASKVEGRVVRFEQGKTGSWFAHAKDDKLWLDRLVVRKDDGEIVIVNLDRYSHVEVVADGTGEALPVERGHARSSPGRTNEPGIALNSPDRRTLTSG